MSSFMKGVTDFLGLDIGVTGIRIVQLKGSGTPKSLVKYAYVPVNSNIAVSDSQADRKKLSQVIGQLIKQAGVNTNYAAVGIPSDRVFTTVTDADKLSNNELAKAIPYQADALIPTPLAESKIDWALLGDSPADKTKQEILLTSVSSKYVEDRLDMLESIGLNVIAFEPDHLALARSVASTESAPQLIIDMGYRTTDLVIVMDGKPHLTRNIPTGLESLYKGAVQNLNIDQKQAEQFVSKFGLSQEKLEGQVYQAIIGNVELMITEVEKSIKYFQTRYNGMKIEKIIVTGATSVIPEFPLFIANKFGISVEIGNAWRNVAFSRDRQNELLAISNQFSVAVGLAERL
jgi:type IV pilus assembly protein PilM